MNTISSISFGNRHLVQEGTHSSRKILGKTLEELAEGTKYAKGKFTGTAPVCDKMVQPKFATTSNVKFPQAEAETLDPSSVYHPVIDYKI